MSTALALFMYEKGIQTRLRFRCEARMRTLPLLFNSLVGAIMRKIFRGRQGVQFGEDQFATDLALVDDSAIFADTEANDIPSATALPYELTINV